MNTFVTVYNSINKKIKCSFRYLSLLESVLDFSYQPLEGLRGETELLGDEFGAECGSDETLEEQSCVLVSLLTQLILSSHDHTLQQQFLHTCRYQSVSNCAIISLMPRYPRIILPIENIYLCVLNAISPYLVK